MEIPPAIVLKNPERGEKTYSEKPVGIHRLGACCSASGERVLYKVWGRMFVLPFHQDGVKGYKIPRPARLCFQDRIVSFCPPVFYLYRRCCARPLHSPLFVANFLGVAKMISLGGKLPLRYGVRRISKPGLGTYVRVPLPAPFLVRFPFISSI